MCAKTKLYIKILMIVFLCVWVELQVIFIICFEFSCIFQILN